MRENLIERMIAIYGYENPIVVQFCQMCETWAHNNWNDKMLTVLVEVHEADPCYDYEG